MGAEVLKRPFRAVWLSDIHLGTHRHFQPGAARRHSRRACLSPPVRWRDRPTFSPTSPKWRRPAWWTRISAPRFAEPCVPIPGTQGHMPCAFPGNSAAQFLGKSGAGQARGL